MHVAFPHPSTVYGMVMRLALFFQRPALFRWLYLFRLCWCILVHFHELCLVVLGRCIFMFIPFCSVGVR